MANVTTNFLPKGPNWIMKKVAMKASTAFAEGAAMGIEISGNDVTGYATLMGTENAAGADFVGIIAEAVVSGDDDYATAGKLKTVWIPTGPRAKAKFAVGAGTFTAVDVGRTVEFHSDSLGLAVDTAGKGARITGYVSSTEGECEFILPATETA